MTNDVASREARDSEPLLYTGHLIRRAQQLHVAIWTREVSSEVSSVQFATLAVLARRPGLSQRELGTELDLDRSTIADLVTRLLRRGLIMRTANPHDRRRKDLALTTAGIDQLAELRAGVERVEAEFTRLLGADDRGRLRAILRHLVGGPIEPG